MMPLSKNLWVTHGHSIELKPAKMKKEKPSDSLRQEMWLRIV